MIHFTPHSATTPVPLNPTSHRALSLSSLSQRIATYFSQQKWVFLNWTTGAIIAGLALGKLTAGAVVLFAVCFETWNCVRQKQRLGQSLASPSAQATPTPEPLVPRKILVPNKGLPNGQMVCWMNTACQIVFRTPNLAQALYEWREPTPPTPISNFIKTLQTLLKQIMENESFEFGGLGNVQYKENEYFHKIKVTQTKLVNAYGEIDPAFKQKLQAAQMDSNRTKLYYDPRLFLTNLIQGLNLPGKLRIVLINELTTSSCLGPLAPKFSFPNEVQKNFYHRAPLTQIPDVLVTQIVKLPTDRTKEQDIPLVVDFSPLFSPTIQTQNSPLNYKLVGAVCAEPLQGALNLCHYIAYDAQNKQTYNDLTPTLPVQGDKEQQLLKRATLLSWERIYNS